MSDDEEETPPRKSSSKRRGSHSKGRRSSILEMATSGAGDAAERVDAGPRRGARAARRVHFVAARRELLRLAQLGEDQAPVEMHALVCADQPTRIFRVQLLNPQGLFLKRGSFL